jgi:hypothetical protein
VVKVHVHYVQRAHILTLQVLPHLFSRVTFVIQLAQHRQYAIGEKECTPCTVGRYQDGEFLSLLET